MEFYKSIVSEDTILYKVTKDSFLMLTPTEIIPGRKEVLEDEHDGHPYKALVCPNGKEDVFYCDWQPIEETEWDEAIGAFNAKHNYAPL